MPAGRSRRNDKNRQSVDRNRQHAGTFPFAGFERSPTGRLLAQIVEIEGPVGIAYERSVGFAKDVHVHDRDMLVCSRGASRMRITTPRPRAVFDFGAHEIMFVPRNLVHDDASLTAVYDTFAIYPDAKTMDELFTDNRIATPDRARLNVAFVAERSRWLDDLLDRYFYLRVLDPSPPIGAAHLYEKQIMNELARLVFADARAPTATPRAMAIDDLCERTLRFVEAHLFEAIDLDLVCRHMGTTPATLLRRFKAALGCSPGQYLRDRRLDEAMLLLERSGARVEEVALLVGYGEVSSFSRAFKSKFGKSPAAIIASS